jgi:hypothetical protein
MPKLNAKKRRVNRVKGFASRGRGKKWILIVLVVLLLIPAMQVAVVRFIRVKGFASRGSQGYKRPNVLRLCVAGKRLRPTRLSRYKESGCSTYTS